VIDLYSWKTPNGHKIHIALEEMKLAYEVHPVDIGQGEQFKPEFLAVSPNNKIPAIVDREGSGGRPLSVFESGAILIYLAEKSGRFLPTDPGRRAETLQWLMWQMGGIGPMMGQAFHFIRTAEEDIPYAVKRYSDEVRRLFGVADKYLAGHAYLGGEYSIADMAAYPWMRLAGHLEIDLARYAHVRRWLDEIGERPAVQKGLTLIE
jgi:GST-like protein